MGWAFYTLSGGSDFDPEATRLSRIEAPSAVETALLQSSAENRETAVPEITATPVKLELASVQEVLTPKPTLVRQPARVVPRAETAEAEPAAVDLEAEPQIILPSLIEGAVPSEAGSVTPVDFSRTSTSAAEAITPQDRRVVSGNRVNVRGGPGTNFQVVNKLVRGDAVEVLEDPGNGWVRLRPVGGGTVGWMADFLLTDG